MADDAQAAVRSAGGSPGAGAFLAEGGELGRLIADFDWGSTPLGPAESWKQSLRSAVSICVASKFPIVMYWGRELTVIYNDAYSEILGSKHPWALGQPCAVCWAEIWDTIGPMLAEVVSSGRASWSDDLELLLERSGVPEECYFSFSFSPVRVEDGSVGGVFTAVVETTRRVLNDRRLRVLSRLGEQALGAHSSLEAATRIADAVADTRALPFSLIYLRDERGVPVVAASTGIARETIAALPEWPFDEVAATGRAATVGFDPAALRPERSWAHDLKPASAIVAPLGVAGAGAPLGFLVTATNPLRPLDDDYLAFFDILAKQVSAAIVHGDAYEAERHRAEALAELDRAKTEFFSNVSHEFRTPLTLMLGPLESLLAEATPGSREAHELDMARRNALRLLKLVNTLLDFARIESLRGEARIEPVDLAAFTADLASVFRAAIERAGLTLVVDCPPLSRPVDVDRDMWEKVVLNLLSNALKFTLEGEIAVRVAEAGGAAVVTVSDTGAGIAEDELARIFDRFYRVHDVASRTHEGAGIGLALVKELVEMMGGQIAVASRRGHGTEFRVTIPFAAGAPKVPAAGMTPSPAATAFAAEAMGWVGSGGPRLAPADGTPHREGRILLVDDNADMRAYLADILGARWNVEAVGDGREALAAARRSRPDLILTDVMMPGVDGLELLHAVRADEGLRDVPVVILSARAGDAPVDGLTRGADDYVVKPFTAEELMARVSTNMKLAAMRAELARSRAELGLAGERASFLNMAAHELRTPLTVIGGYIDLILGGVLKPGSDDAMAALEKVAHKTKEGVRLVEQMLTAARMEAGAIAVHTSAVDLRRAADEAASRARPLAELEGSEIRTTFPADAVAAQIDAALVGLILDNLIANAVFHGAGPIRVEVLASPPRVRVVDSGPGVARAARNRIFEPFYQVESQLRAGSGAGLGLAVSRRLAEMHGGSLILEETVGGASFLLTVPAAESSGSQVASAGS